MICSQHRVDFDRFIDGAEFGELGEPCRLLVGKFFFIPVAERSIEAKHSLAKMALCSSRLKGSTVNISLSNRLPMLKDYLLANPKLFPEFLDCFQEARNHVSAVRCFGMQEHPVILDLVGQHHTKFTKALRALNYRADILEPHVFFVSF